MGILMNRYIDQLNQKYGINGHILFKAMADDYPPCAILKSDFSICEISLYGAHVLSFIPADSVDLLMLSSKAVYKRGKAIRGGIPICWPWFGPNAAERTLPAHGFARISEWLVSNSGINQNDVPFIKFYLESNEESKKYWPCKFRLELTVMASSSLSVSLTTFSKDFQDMTISNALHSYLKISSINDIEITGIENTQYIDSTDNDKRKLQKGPLRISGEVDRAYINTENDCFISDPGLNRIICVSKQNSKTTVIWNPWIKKGNTLVDFDYNGFEKMVCIETANAVNNTITLKPGGRHTVSMNIQQSVWK